MLNRRSASLSLAGLAAAAWNARAQTLHRITVQVQVPEGTGVVYLTGDRPELGPWDPKRLAMQGAGRERTAVLQVPQGTAFEFKVTLGSWDREGLGPSGTVMPNFRDMADADKTVAVTVVSFKKDATEYMADPAGSGVLGRLVYWQNVESRHLSQKRHVEVWLPPGYDTSGSQRYPVLYMHDGQNLFDPRMAAGGIDWGVDEAVVRSVRAGRMPPIIVVGVWNSSRRVQEYSPWAEGPAYARFLIEELMPRVNREWRTATGPAQTGTMGSSMGGLISFYLVWKHGQVFGRAGCVSTHFPFPAYVPGPGQAKPQIEVEIASGAVFPPGPRMYFDHGTVGLDAAYAAEQAKVTAWLKAQGHVEGRDFIVRAFEGADHSEAAWRARLDEPLGFLYRA
jgi:enterochelin esterase-like enzyme